MRQSAVSFVVKGLSFEGVIAQPDDGGGPLPGVVICHPHPLFGGNMDNNVVLAVSFALVELGIATMRFNFRGVGNSEGEHTKGEKEQEEVIGALELMKAWPAVDSRHLGLSGYSFGASVVLDNPSLHNKARAFALISPPLRALESTKLKETKRPTMVIAGDRDKLVQANRFAELLESFSKPPACHIVPGADHYWFGQEGRLAPPVAEFFVEHLK